MDFVMSRKACSEVQNSLDWEISNYWIHVGYFDADKIIANTKKIVEFIESQELTLDQLSVALSKESASVQDAVKSNITEDNTLQDMLNWKNDRDKHQMKLLVKQFICSQGVKSAEEIIGMLKIIQQYTRPPLQYIKEITNDEREKYDFRQLIINRIAEKNNFELPNIDVVSTLDKLEDFLFYSE